LQGPQGPAGPGIATGGRQGQALVKASDTPDYATTWAAINQVPTGGTSGQVLTANATGGYGWAALSGGLGLQPNWLSLTNRVNYYYNNIFNPASGISGSSIPANSTYYFPVVLPKQMQIDTVGVTGGAAANSVPGSIGFLSNNVDTNLPGALIASTTITVSAANTTATVPLAATLPAGLCWIGLGSNSASYNFNYTGHTNNSARNIMPYSTGAGNVTSVVVLSAAAPTVAGSPTVLGTSQTVVPTVFFRCSAA
jgi:hypothetical protein